MIAENSRDTAVLEASGPQGHVFIYSLGECVYRISGLYEFSFGQEVPYKPTTCIKATRVETLRLV